MNSPIAKKVQDFDVTIFNFIINSIFTVNQDVKYNDKFEIDKLIACYDCASNLFKKRLMFRYAQSKSTNHFNLIDSRLAEPRSGSFI